MLRLGRGGEGEGSISISISVRVGVGVGVVVIIDTTGYDTIRRRAEIEAVIDYANWWAGVGCGLRGSGGIGGNSHVHRSEGLWVRGI